MSFFTLSDGQTANTDGTMEMGGGDDFSPIPKDTNVLAAITETKIDEYQGDKHIKNTWTILQPAEYKNRKIFQKIQAYHADNAKRDKALRMLAAIDANCGGKLVSSGKEPTNELLTQCLLNKPMVLNLQVWEITEDRNGAKLPEDEIKRGNWVSKVSPRKATQQQEAPKPEPVTNPSDMYDDSIPF